jgi:intraflagellar transport protein 140
LENKQYEKAVSLFVTARNFEQALDLCAKHNVKVDEKMADKMTPPPATSPEEKKKRDTVLTRIATLCHDQRSYHLACKKFTQAGDKERAMKCLLKSDDTEKITAYASMTKNNAVYVLAANHLQKLDWYNNAELMKTIIQFYAKARAMRELSAFYDSCALHEIDDFRDYEKALDALREALKYAIKAKPAADRDAKLNSLENRIKLVEKFVSARKLVKTNAAEMVRLATSLLDTPDVESAVRVGDVYAELIQYYMSVPNMQAAYALVQRMRQANIVLDPYLDRSIVESIHTAVGVPLPGGGAGGNAAAGSAAAAAPSAAAAAHSGPQVMHLADDGGGDVIDEAVDP